MDEFIREKKGWKRNKEKIKKKKDEEEEKDITRKIKKQRKKVCHNVTD